MKALRAMMAVLTLAIGACGDGAVQSPDFTPELIRVEVTPVSDTVALGQTRQFSAIGVFTTPPGSNTSESSSPIGDVTWSVDDPNRASVDGDGLVSTKAQGTVIVSAKRDGLEGTAQLIIGPPTLLTMTIDPPTANIPLGAQVAFTAKGTYSDAPNTERNITTTVTWSPVDSSVATLSPEQGVTTIATSQTLGVLSITASTIPQGSSTPVTAQAQLTVREADLDSLLRVEPVIATVAKGNTTEFVAYAAYSDGSEAALADDKVDWTSADEATATVDAQGVATGVELGQTTISAQVKPTVPMNDRTKDTASAQLTVTFSGCNTALRASAGAEVVGEVSPLCLLCNVSDESNIIDEDDTNFGELQVPVGLLAATASVTVTSPTVFPETEPAGFIIGRPSGQLINAEVLSQLTIETLMDGVPTGDSARIDSTPLGLALLGTVVTGPYDSDLALLAMPADAVTQAYNGIRLTFDSGLVSAFSSTQVYAACGNAVLPENPVTTMNRQR